MFKFKTAIFTIFILTALAFVTFGQQPSATKVELGSHTARNGFKNETEIRGRFNWKTGAYARAWLAVPKAKWSL